MKLDIPIFPTQIPRGSVTLGPPDVVQDLGRSGVCVLTRDGLILTEGEARFRKMARKGLTIRPGN